MSKSYVIKTLADLPKAVEWLLENAGNKRKFFLYGQMGAGKTTFSSAFAAHFGASEASSPTFSLINEYATNLGKKIYHLDLYRLKNADEALDIGIEDCLFDDNYALVEWPQIVENWLTDAEVLKVHLSVSEDLSRKIEIE